MSHPLIDFLESAALPWQRRDLGFRHGMNWRALSHDKETGARTIVMRLRAGWSLKAPEALTVDESLYVLSGALQLGDETLKCHTYAFLPAGYLRAAMQVAEETTLLVFLDGPAAPASLHEAAALYDEERLIPGIDMRDRAAGDREVLNTVLRRDRLTGAQTWISTVRPLWQGDLATRHDVAVETYLISGSLSGPRGVQKAGAYASLPAGTWHGPYASIDGALQICRTRGGALTTKTRPAAAVFDATYRPTIET